MFKFTGLWLDVEGTDMQIWNLPVLNASEAQSGTADRGTNLQASERVFVNQWETSWWAPPICICSQRVSGLSRATCCRNRAATLHRWAVFTFPWPLAAEIGREKQTTYSRGRRFQQHQIEANDKQQTLLCFTLIYFLNIVCTHVLLKGLDWDALRQQQRQQQQTGEATLVKVDPLTLPLLCCRQLGTSRRRSSPCPSSSWWGTTGRRWGTASTTSSSTRWKYTREEKKTKSHKSTANRCEIKLASN